MKFLTASTLLATSFEGMDGSQPSTMVLAGGPGAATDTQRTPKRTVAPLGSGKSGPAVDAGLLFPGKQVRHLDVECPSGEWVDCADGKTTSDGQECSEACNGLCCRGYRACFSFTGRVCKDNVTCVGDRACADAKIDVVAGGCYGKKACDEAGYWGGTFGKIVASCKGEKACYKAAVEGNIRSILNSCTGYKACFYAAYDQGNIPDISNSCNEHRACKHAGAGPGGGIGGIQNSCNDLKSCENAGSIKYGDGAIASMITSCCNKEKQCYSASEDGLPALPACEITSSPTKSPTSNLTNKPTGSPTKSPTSNPATKPTSSQPTGVPTTLSPTEARHLDTECASGEWVNCTNGKTTSDEDCSEACGGLCCSGTNACRRFTGRVCKDNTSCVGYRACDHAKIDKVVNSCRGDHACELISLFGHVSYGYSNIESILNSCIGYKACDHAAWWGNIPSISNSCNADLACLHAGHGKSNAGDEGGIGGIRNSCNGLKSCQFAGSTWFGNGPITSEITSCCNIEKQCYGASENDLPACDPTKSPTSNPTNKPTSSQPTTTPTSLTVSPTKSPTSNPTNKHTSSQPTGVPTTLSPTKSPTSHPTNKPTSAQPTGTPTTLSPTQSPMAVTGAPTSNPTSQPTTPQPTTSPALSPSESPMATLTCENSRSWTYTPKNRPRRCNWVGRDPDNRCNLIGDNNLKIEANDACKVHCDPACSIPHKTVTIPSMVSLQLAEFKRRLQDSHTFTPSSLAALEEAIGDAALGVMDPASQWVKDVMITSDSGAASTNNVSFELILQELCSPTSDANSMYENVTSYLLSQFENGKFAADLHENAKACGSECDRIKNATVEGWTFDEGVVDANMCAGPWTISFFGIDADWSRSSEHQLVMTYKISKGRNYQTILYEKDCTTNITDITINSTKVRDTKDITHDLITVSHSIDKAAITNSGIYNATSNKIEICQIVNLVVPAAGSLQMMVIAEDLRKVDVDFDLSVDYNLTNYLGAGTTEAAAGAADFSDLMTACKCGGVSAFTCNSAALVPNTQLNVCIKSVSDGVAIDQLMSMVVTQGSASMDVIKAGAVATPSIAGMTYDPLENSKVVVVSTFVPVNIFSYVTNASIYISGGLKLGLMGPARKLRPDNFGDGALDADGNGKALYELKVDLQDEKIVLEEEGAWMESSGYAVVNGASSLLGMAFLFASGMW